jgi:tRNA modification GTPase
VIDAHDNRELDIALRQLAGGLSAPLASLRDRLLDLLAHLEAGLDFVEEDIEFIRADQLTAQLGAARQQVADVVQQMHGRNEMFEGVRIVLVGQPNVGKSSLFNALIDRPGAIVSELPGTTRDYLTARPELGGVPCQLIDTAGSVATRSDVGFAAAAQAMTARQRREAHLRLVCLDASRELRSDERAELAAAVNEQIIVLTKCDLPRWNDLERDAIPNDVTVLATSAKTGAGIDELREAIGNWLREARCHDSEVVGATAVRCQESLRLAAQNLRAAHQACEAGAGEELVAADLRAALDELGQVLGTVYTDDILDRIFSRFCIGK